MPSQPSAGDRPPAPPISPPPESALVPRPPLVLLRDTERSLRVKVVAAIAPRLPDSLVEQFTDLSDIAEESLTELAAIDLKTITDADLQPARRQVGLLFLGFGTLATVFTLMVLCLVHPDRSMAAQVDQAWHLLLWVAGVGISGLFTLGREAMRPVDFSADDEPKDP